MRKIIMLVSVLSVLVFGICIGSVFTISQLQPTNIYFENVNYDKMEKGAKDSIENQSINEWIESLNDTELHFYRVPLSKELNLALISCTDEKKFNYIEKWRIKTNFEGRHISKSEYPN